MGDVGKYIRDKDLIVTFPISYYLTAEDYGDQIPTVPFEKYEACGVTSVNLSTNTVLWSLPLVCYI